MKNAFPFLIYLPKNRVPTMIQTALPRPTDFVLVINTLSTYAQSQKFNGHCIISRSSFQTINTAIFEKYIFPKSIK